MTQAGHIIFLNGTSSAGKTSIARSLQQQLSDPYVHMALDAFLDMFPPCWLDTKGGFGEIQPSGSAATEVIYIGPIAQRLFSGYHRSLAACAVAGNNLIVDHVLLERRWLQECVALLADFSVFFVGLRCPLDMLEARERERGDRDPGQARKQFNLVHIDALYDLEVDTSLGSPEGCAARIVMALRQPSTPSAFQQLSARLSGEPV